MNQIDEKLNVFYRECKKYYFYKNILKKLQEQLTILKNRYESIHSPRFERIAASQSQKENDVMLARYMEEKDLLSEKIDAYSRMVSWIEECISRIKSLSYKYVVWRTCIDGETINELAIEYDISSKQLSRNRKKAILSVLNEAVIKKHDEIEDDILRQEARKLRLIYMGDNEEMMLEKKAAIKNL